jgi:hypothetical protein
MAVGDDATGAGFPLVPDSGEEGRVRWGAREINRTRDMIAVVKAMIPIGKVKWREASGITSGTSVPSNSTGNDGDIYFKII